MTLILKQREDPKEFDSEQFFAKNLLTKGVKLYGYCGGRFGRDGYADKTVIKVEGNCIHVEMNGEVDCSFEIQDWVGLIESSNQALKDEEEENERN